MEQTLRPGCAVGRLFVISFAVAIVVFLSVMTTGCACTAPSHVPEYQPQTASLETGRVSGVRLSTSGSQIPGILDNFQNFLLITGSVFIPASLHRRPLP
jgi:hypothetical protein